MANPAPSTLPGSETNERIVRLLAVEPGLGRFLDEGEQQEARRIALPVHDLRPGPFDVREFLENADAFGAIVLEGMMLQRLRVADQVAVRLIGPGDLISLTEQPRSMLLLEAESRVVGAARVALLGSQARAAVRRWPALLDGFQVRVAEQADRLTAQLVICQLPRVEDRLLAMVWLLAETWGHVTSAGTTLPISLTHDVLGGLVGARRSTVTLALGELTERGALMKQDRGWLLLEPPPPPLSPSWLAFDEIEEPRPVDQADTDWKRDESNLDAVRARGPELIEQVERLRAEHIRTCARVREQLARAREARERRQALRRRSGDLLGRLHHQDHP